MPRKPITVLIYHRHEFVNLKELMYLASFVGFSLFRPAVYFIPPKLCTKMQTVTGTPEQRAVLKVRVPTALLAARKENEEMSDTP
jgi:hypothetical protein